MITPPVELEVLCICIAFKIRRSLPLLDGLNQEVVGLLNMRKRQTLLDERASALWQSRWDSSTHSKLTYNFIRTVFFIKNHTQFAYSLHLGFPFTGHESLIAFCVCWQETYFDGLSCRVLSGEISTARWLIGSYYSCMGFLSLARVCLSFRYSSVVGRE